MIIQFFWALKFKNGGKNVQLIFNSYIYIYIYISLILPCGWGVLSLLGGPRPKAGLANKSTPSLVSHLMSPLNANCHYSTMHRAKHESFSRST